MPASVYVPSPHEARVVDEDASIALKTSATSHTSAVNATDDDSSLRTVDALLRRRARLHPDTHAVSYPSSGVNFVHYTLQQLDVFAWRVAKHFETTLPVRKTSAETPIVVGLLGVSNLEYLITMLAMTKLGHSVLLLSTRIPQPAVENLMQVTGAAALVTDERYAPMAEAVQTNMPETRLFRIANRSLFEFSIDTVGDTQLDAHLDPEVEQNYLAYIIHSSGSTGLPKPICHTRKSSLANFQVNMKMKAFITLPLFHGHGLYNFFRSLHALVPIYIYNADLPLTNNYLATVLRENQIEIFYGVPYALKLLAESDEGLMLLQQLKAVMFGGSACPDDLGNLLVDSGVNLIGHYGASEVGQLMTSLRPEGDKAWNYVREHDRVSPFLKWIPRGPNLYECCITDGWPAKVKSNHSDNSYLTSDLFEPHPTIPRAWKYICRLDDTIALVNGEKVGPLGMEGSIRSNKNVAEAVVFGSGRPCAGILVIPAPHLADTSKEEVRDIIWPAVEAANLNVDSFGRIDKAMICVLPANAACPRTDKGSIIRQAFYKTFKAEIDATYDAQDRNIDNAVRYELPQLCEFLRTLLSKTLGLTSDIADDCDLFLLGLDSLQAIQIRSEILRSVDIGGKTLGQNVVFDHPSIDNLSLHLHALSTGEDASIKSSSESQMEALIEKYERVNEPPKTSVVLTGGTGSLGAHVISILANDPSITKIYCLVRAADKPEALQRTVGSLIQRRLYHSLSLESRRKIIALPSSLDDPRLGLSVEDYNAISSDLRSVVHCAWSVNFNMQLASFEKSNIAGVNNLLALCKSATQSATFNFCSSVSTCGMCPVSPVPEALPELSWAQGLGYAQSKAVAEHICARASSQGIKARVLRIGQIMGDTVHGVWNAQEAVPMLMQTAITVGALPKLKEALSWLPVDIVAQAVIDISLSSTDAVFTNVLHPKTFNFVDHLIPALRAAGLTFDEVEPKEWVQRLRSSTTDPKVNPPIKLLEFFASKYDKTEFAPSRTFSTELSCSLSPALASVDILDAEFVKKFVDYFLQTSWSLQSTPNIKTAIIVTGPPGVGKTTVGSAISGSLGSPFIEGESLHLRTVGEKLRSNVALAEIDSEAWLARVSSHAREALEDLAYDQVVTGCPSLKRSHRDQLRNALKGHNIRAIFIDLQAGRDVLLQRLQSGRKQCADAANILDARAGAYEAAATHETDVLPVDAEDSAELVIENAKWLLQAAM